MQIRKVKKKVVKTKSWLNPAFDEDGFCIECGKSCPNSDQFWCCSACLEAKRTLKGHFKCSYDEDFCQCEPKLIIHKMIRTHVRGSKGELYTYP